jgi:hypothetical protein
MAMPRELGSSPQVVVVSRPEGDVSGVVEASAQIDRQQALLSVRLETGELVHVAVLGLTPRGGRATRPVMVREVGTRLVDESGNPTE